jgi:excisionase family DNA binding protein
MRSNVQDRVSPRTRLDPLLSVDETAAYLRVSRRQVYLLLDAGKIPAVRVGSRLRFVPSELLAYLEKHREERAP